MATSMPQPGGPQQPPAGGPPQASGSQANPLQEALGKIAMFALQGAPQNVIIQPELQQIAQLAKQALLKVSQAAPGRPQQLGAQ